VCTRTDRGEIDVALIEQQPNRRVAARYGLTEQAIRRHRNGHLPARLARAHDAKEVAWADGLLDQLRDLQRRTLGIMTVAEETGDVRTALVAITVARGNLALLAGLWNAPGRPAWWTGEARWTPPDEPAGPLTAEQAAVVREMPPTLREQIKRWLLERRERYLAEQREAAERRMLAFMPSAGRTGMGTSGADLSQQTRVFRDIGTSV
jgi:hypothetical protein